MIGDSKTLTATLPVNEPGLTFHEQPTRFATAGAGTYQESTLIDDQITAASGAAPNYVFYNFGANDVLSMNTEAQFKQWSLYIWDAIHTQWPDAVIYFMRPWRRNYLAECDILAGWLSDLRSQRTFIRYGPDERIFLADKPNGPIVTLDGTHPNADGTAETARQWLSAVVRNA
jgi:lysophospholipase L1-like esterase